MLAELFAVALFIGFYLYVRYQDRIRYWDKLGVSSVTEAPFPWGNNPVTCKDAIKQTKNQGDVVEEQYAQFPHDPFYGNYFALNASPVLNIKEPELVKHVLIKDFDHFVDRNNIVNFFGSGRTKTDRIWQRVMVNLKGDEWRDVRSTFTPIFTSGKLKLMMSLLQGVTEELMHDIDQSSHRPIDLKVIFGKFSMDSIATSAFGVRAGSFQDKESKFVSNARGVFGKGPRDALALLSALMPGLGSILGALKIPLFKPAQTEFFYNVVVNTLRNRQETKTRRNDIIDLMIDAMKKDLTDETNDHASDQYEADSTLNYKPKSKDLDEVTIVSTAMVMLIAGYDTTASTLSQTAWHLAQNQDIQDKLLQEIDSAFDDTEEDNLDYTTVQGLEYLDMVIHETLRLNPPAPFLTRACIKDYRIPNSNVVIKKGHEIHIPVAGIHKDSRYYPDPECYNPENFSKEAKSARSPYTFLGFGQGPRACIGMRFALLEAKIGLVEVLRRYRIVTCEETPMKITRDPAMLIANPLERLWVKLEKRE